MIHVWYFWWKIHPGYMYQAYILYKSSLHEAMALVCLKRKQWNNGSCFAIFLGLSLENLDWDSQIQNKMDFWLPVHLNLNIDNPNYDLPFYYCTLGCSWKWMVHLQRWGLQIINKIKTYYTVISLTIRLWHCHKLGGCFLFINISFIEI